MWRVLFAIALAAGLVGCDTPRVSAPATAPAQVALAPVSPLATGVSTATPASSPTTVSPSKTLASPAPAQNAIEGVWLDTTNPGGEVEFFGDGRAEFRFGQGFTMRYKWKWIDGTHISFALGDATETREVSLGGDALAMKTSSGSTTQYKRK